jgi:hypothetical protein
MANSHLANKGQCRCGQVRFEVSGRPVITFVCHCSGCQRMTGSAYSLSALYADTDFKVTMGEPVIGGLHGVSRHYFCAHCMSWLFTRPEGLDEFVNIRATMMEDARSFRPFVETYTAEMLEWAATPAEYRFEKFPPRERIPELIAAFAKQFG